MGKSEGKRTVRFHDQTPFWKTLESRAQSLDAQFRHILQEHRGGRGEAKEAAVGDFLSDLIPRRFSISPGEIIDTLGGRSPAMDLIVYDAMETPILERYRDRVVVPVEGVYAVIEVASKIDSAKMEDDLKKIREAKQLTKKAYWNLGTSRTWRIRGKTVTEFPILGVCFGYKGIDIEKLEAVVAKHDADSPQDNVDAVFALDQGFVAHASETDRGSRWSLMPVTGSERASAEFEDPDKVLGGTLGAFFNLFATALLQADTAHINLLPYSQPPSEE